MQQVNEDGTVLKRGNNNRGFLQNKMTEFQDKLKDLNKKYPARDTTKRPY